MSALHPLCCIVRLALQLLSVPAVNLSLSHESWGIGCATLIEFPVCRAEKATAPEEATAPAEDETPPPAGDDAPAADAADAEPETPKEPEKVSWV